MNVSLDELVVDPAGPPIADQVAGTEAAEYADVIAAAVAQAVDAATG